MGENHNPDVFFMRTGAYGILLLTQHAPGAASSVEERSPTRLHTGASGKSL